MSNRFVEELKKRILVLDGAMGTSLQTFGLTEEDYRGEIFKDSVVKLKGNSDILSLTRPDVVTKIHESYLIAGADIIETNTFNGTKISQKDYLLENMVYRINFESSRLAREVADRFTYDNPDKPRFVAGSIGPTSKTLSISADVDDPGARAVSFDELENAYEEQVEGLIDGGVDILFVETVFDGLNARAAIVAANNVFERKGVTLPIMVSSTLAGKGGRILSGQTIEAFAASVRNQNVISIGFNCSFGARELIPFVKELAAATDLYISLHPNAGLPDKMGRYEEEPHVTASLLSELADAGILNVVGGCCGTNAGHIEAIAKMVHGKAPRSAKLSRNISVFAGLEAVYCSKENNFLNIGERTNVAGSKKFAKLIAEKKYDEALEIAREQVENGALVIDVNFDDAMLESKEEMERFLKLIAVEPEISKVPVMIDSSNWEVLEIGLKSLQGKHIVNSISLKNGEDDFINKAKIIKKYGAAVVVMAFDENGQADTFERKIAVCKRAYEILVERAGFAPEDIIFDPNILAIATGIEAHNNYAVDYIQAVKWIKANLPHAKVSGGISNLSFAFRGNNKIREAMHSVFLYHAISAGMDMGILNPGMIQIYDEIDKGLLECIEAVVLNVSPDAGEKLIDFASTMGNEGAKDARETKVWRTLTPRERLKHSVLNGIEAFLTEDLDALRELTGSAIGIIEGPLMDGMKYVGELFGDGKMFLPQVVKSARAMKRAVKILEPHIEEEKRRTGQLSEDLVQKRAGKIVLASVKGDVHDIGKNIVGVVLSCNDFEVIDLGVMVPAEQIISKAKEVGADLIGLSGLITPSLEEMCNVAELMEKEGLDIPIMIGGATTSKVHTAVKISTLYSGGVVHVLDASKSVEVSKKLCDKSLRHEYLGMISDEYEDLRRIHGNVRKEFVSLDEARLNRKALVINKDTIKKPIFVGIKVFDDYQISAVRKYIDWAFFFKAWEIKGVKVDGTRVVFENGDVQAQKLYNEANSLIDLIESEKMLTLKAVLGIFPANSQNDDILVYENEDRQKVIGRFPMIRQQEKIKGRGSYLALSDFIARVESGEKDYIGAFALTAGIGEREIADRMKASGDDYSALMVRFVADRLAEAFAEALHEEVRKNIWGYAKDEDLSVEDVLKGQYLGIRPAVGYPAFPDHSEKLKIFEMLGVERHTGITLCGAYSMIPESSICGLYFATPESEYFDVGKVTEEMVADYACRKGLDVGDVSRLLGNRVWKNRN